MQVHLDVRARAQRVAYVCKVCVCARMQCLLVDLVNRTNIVKATACDHLALLLVVGTCHDLGRVWIRQKISWVEFHNLQLSTKLYY